MTAKIDSIKEYYKINLKRNFFLYKIIKCLVVVQSPSHVRLCNPMVCSTLGLPVLHHPLEFAQVHVHCNGG